MEIDYCGPGLLCEVGACVCVGVYISVAQCPCLILGCSALLAKPMT